MSSHLRARDGGEQERQPIGRCCAAVSSEDPVVMIVRLISLLSQVVQHVQCTEADVALHLPRPVLHLRQHIVQAPTAVPRPRIHLPLCHHLLSTPWQTHWLQ